MIPVVIPVAGHGTRSLPASKAIPKEMLPVFDRPAVQWIVEEAVQAHCSQVVFVNSRGKEAIENHFDISPDLEAVLQKAGKQDLLKVVSQLARMIPVQSVRQKEQLGLGHAVSMAETLISSERFGVMLGDDLVDAPIPGIQQLIDAAQKLPADAGVIMLMKVPEADLSKYGICELNESTTPFKISKCLEKPKSTETTSRWGIVGRYLLPRDLFEILKKNQRGSLGEIQLTDGLNELAKAGRLFGIPLQGNRFDVGDRLGHLRAHLHYGLKSPLGGEIKKLLKEMSQ